MTEEQAKQRFLMLNITRLFGVAVAFAGIANISGKFLPDMAPVLGYVLLVIGAADFFISPILLKHIWKKQDQ